MPEKFYTSDPKLKNHKRVGKKLLAPLSSERFPQLQDSDWIVERLPELVWIGEMIHFLGPPLACTTLTAIVKAAHDAWRENDPGPTFLASAWQNMRQSVKDHVIRCLRVEGLLSSLQHALALLIRLYPEYPLKFIVEEQHLGTSASNDLRGFKHRLAQLFDRFELPALKIHGHIFLAETRAGLLTLPADFHLPDPMLLYEEGKTPIENREDFQKLAGYLRASTMSMFGAFRGQLSVGSYFWARGIQLEKCNYEES